MIGRVSRILVATAFVLTVASCYIHNVDGELRDLSVRYARPSLQIEDGAHFGVGTNYRTSFNTTVSRLKEAGFEILSADSASGEIRAESNANTLVSCGELSVGERGSLRIFPGNSALAVIEVPAGPGKSTFFRRQVDVHTIVNIGLGAGTNQSNEIIATVAETHTVKLILAQVTDGQVVYEQTIQFSGAESARFTRGVECGSSREVRSIILGN